MEELTEYIAFDLEFNTVNDRTDIIQVSAVKFKKHKEIAQFDTYVYTDMPLKSFINGLTGITSDKINTAPKIDKVLNDFSNFIGKLPLIGYNAVKSDLPLLEEKGLKLFEQYAVDVFDEAYERRSMELNGIANLKLHTVAQFLGFDGKSHNSLEDARMTAKVYESFLESDSNKALLNQQEGVLNNPFAGLNLTGLFDD